MNLFNIDFDTSTLPGEPSEGHIEYKLLYLKKELPNNKIKKLATQMLWRLTEGFYNTDKFQAYYILGVYDKGKVGNISKENILETIDIFNQVCLECKSKIKNKEIIETKYGHIGILHIIREEPLEML